MDRANLVILMVLLAGGILSATPEKAAAQSRAVLDLLWQAETVVPPFYPGLPLPSAGSYVKVVAIADFRNAGGVPIKTSDLRFEWIKDGKSIHSHSGRGINQLTYRAEGEGNEITVTALTKNNSISARKTIFIPTVEPRLMVFEDDPLSGINFNRPLKQTLVLAKPEITLVGEPFFFSFNDALNNALNYDWRLQDKKIISQPENQKVAVLAVPEGGVGGENTIRLRVKNSNNVLQEARTELIIKFGRTFNGF